MIKEDPPARDTTDKTPLGRRYGADLEKVKAEPFEWFRLIDLSSKRDASARAWEATGKLRRQTSGFEFRSGRGCVYVRWVGEAAS